MPIKLTQDQIYEVLNRLRSYSYYFYYGEMAREYLSRHSIDHGGRRFSIFVRDDGFFEVKTEDGLSIIFESKIVTGKPSSSTAIDNLEYKAAIVNKADLSPEERLWAEEIAIFVCSTIQRTAAFVFLARAHDGTIDRMAQELSMMNVS